MKKEEKTTIPSDDNMGKFGMDSVGEPKKYVPNKVKEVEGINNSVEID